MTPQFWYQGSDGLRGQLTLIVSNTIHIAAIHETALLAPPRVNGPRR